MSVERAPEDLLDAILVKSSVMMKIQESHVDPCAVFNETAGRKQYRNTGSVNRVRQVVQTRQTNPKNKANGKTTRESKSNIHREIRYKVKCLELFPKGRTRLHKASVWAIYSQTNERDGVQVCL